MEKTLMKLEIVIYIKENLATIFSGVDSGGAGGSRAPPELEVQKRGKAWFLLIGV